MLTHDVWHCSQLGPRRYVHSCRVDHGGDRWILMHDLRQTVTVLSNFMLAMVLHPEAFRRAQDELDRVVGRSRLPDFEDRGSLPYLDCILREVLRCDDCLSSVFP